MKTCQYISALLLTSASLLSGCEKDLINGDENNNLYDPAQHVLFTAQVDDGAATRGMPVEHAADMASMGVYCLATGADGWSTSAVANKMDNRKMVRDEDTGKWEYDGDPVRWDAAAPTDRYSFFAYAPYAAAANNGVATLGVMDGKPSLLYTLPADVTLQPDLMMAVPRYDVRPTHSAVALQMKHALTCVGFQIRGTGERVAKISIENVYGQGYAVVDGDNIAWTTTGLANDIGSVAIRFDNKYTNYYTCTSAMTNPIAGNGYLMMIPQTLGPNAKVRITLSDGTSKEIPLNSHTWSAGKKVTYNIDMQKLTISLKRTYGWGYYENDAGYLMQPGSGTRKIVDASANFGTNANSAVKIERYSPAQTFDHTVLSTGKGVYISQYIKEMFDNKPDIVFTGYDLAVNDPVTVAGYVMNYLRNDGVLVLALEHHTFALRIFQAMYPGRTIMTGGVDEWDFQIANTVNDEITNGPFGDIRGRYWGNDVNTECAVRGLPEDEIVVYSRTQYGDPIMFRHKNYNLFFIGDGGAFANLRGGTGSTAGTAGSTETHPLAFDNNFKPITRTGWRTANGNGSVENSRLFANIMAWAVKQAEYKGINTK
ncbi:MAG: fimbrillin family protein [Bacteroidales bacterium]|jgi:hypothetical protein|nr:fimbrillin family protein [Bacteroidales bacterium]